MSIQLNSCQQAAVGELIKFLRNSKQTEIVLRGFAGTGKTTLVKYILDNFEKFESASEALGSRFYSCEDIAVTATTRKAARVIAETLSTEPVTIHSYLGLVLRNDYKTGETYLQVSKNARPAENTLLFIDEASFIDSALLNMIRTQTTGCKIIFMGDPCQLISVNATASPIFDGKIPSVSLTTVMRNEGAISELSAQFRETVLSSQFKPIFTDNEKVVHVTGDVFQSMIDKAFTSDNYVPDKSAKVLAWTNSRVHAYNDYIAKARGLTRRFNRGDTLISNSPLILNSEVKVSTDETVVISDYEETAINGVMGNLVRLKDVGTFFVPDNEDDKRLLLKQLAKLRDWREYFEVKETWADLRPAYAATVHKSQGSTYDKVFIDLSDIGTNNKRDEVARLLYVAISRASTQVILYGELPEQYQGATHGTEKTSLQLL